MGLWAKLRYEVPDYLQMFPRWHKMADAQKYILTTITDSYVFWLINFLGTYFGYPNWNTWNTGLQNALATIQKYFFCVRNSNCHVITRNSVLYLKFATLLCNVESRHKCLKTFKYVKKSFSKLITCIKAASLYLLIVAPPDLNDNNDTWYETPTNHK